MADQVSHESFEEGLDELESAATAAIVPGDCEPWCRVAREAATVMEKRLLENVERHEQNFDSILADNVALTPRVETLREQDAELREMLEDLGARLEDVADECADSDSSEEPIRLVRALRLKLLRWLERARIQESELDAWVLEATHRDVGSAGD